MDKMGVFFEAIKTFIRVQAGLLLALAAWCLGARMCLVMVLDYIR